MREMLQYASRFRRLYQKSFQPLGEEWGLSQLEMDMLLFLHNNPDRNTARDMVALRGFAKSNVSTAVDALERDGWLRVAPDPDSRRMKRLFLQPERQAAVTAMAQCQEWCFSAVLAGFTKEELAGLRELMLRLDANVRHALGELEQKGGR